MSWTLMALCALALAQSPEGAESAPQAATLSGVRANAVEVIRGERPDWLVVEWGFRQNPVRGEWRVSVRVQNVSGYVLEIDWSRSAFVDVNGNAVSLVPLGATNDVTGALAPSVIPPGATLSKRLVPRNTETLRNSGVLVRGGDAGTQAGVTLALRSGGVDLWLTERFLFYADGELPPAPPPPVAAVTPSTEVPVEVPVTPAAPPAEATEPAAVEPPVAAVEPAAEPIADDGQADLLLSLGLPADAGLTALQARYSEHHAAYLETANRARKLKRRSYFQQGALSSPALLLGSSALFGLAMTGLESTDWSDYDWTAEEEQISRDAILILTGSTVVIGGTFAWLGSRRGSALRSESESLSQQAIEQGEAVQQLYRVIEQMEAEQAP